MGRPRAHNSFPVQMMRLGVEMRPQQNRLGFHQTKECSVLNTKSLKRRYGMNCLLVPLCPVKNMFICLLIDSRRKEIRRKNPIATILLVQKQSNFR